MTSAFSQATPCDLPRTVLVRLSSAHADEAAIDSETEDEEVKQSCMGRKPTAEGSDVSLDPSSCSDSDESSSELSRSDGHKITRGAYQGVVKFVSRSIPSILVVRPKPSRSCTGELCPHPENDDDSTSSSTTTPAFFDCGGESRGQGLPFSQCADSIQESSDSSQSSRESKDMQFEEESSYDASSQGSKTDVSAWMDIEIEEMDRSTLDEVGSVECGQKSSLCGSSSDTDFASLEDGRYIVGVVKDCETMDAPRNQNAKRVLSFNTLSSLNVDAASRVNDGSASKRTKQLPGIPLLSLPPLTVCPYGNDTLPILIPRVSSMMEESPVISTNTEEEGYDLDRTLREELDVSTRSRENTPVPLLTPPQSPLTVSIGGSTTTICEWPSNLAIDSAMSNITELRALSPTLLQVLGRSRRGSDKNSTLITPVLRTTA